MNKWIRILLLLPIGVALFDTVRYFLPGSAPKIPVQVAEAPLPRPREFIFVYNANGGIFASVVDFGHKILSPSTYNCRLCYLTFGTFSMKEEWKAFLERLPGQKFFYHKDTFAKNFAFEEGAYPAIFISDGSRAYLLASRAQINGCSNLAQLQDLVLRNTEQLLAGRNINASKNREAAQSVH